MGIGRRRKGFVVHEMGRRIGDDEYERVDTWEGCGMDRIGIREERGAGVKDGVESGDEDRMGEREIQYSIREISQWK